MGLGGGLLLAVPIPEEHAAAGQEIEEAIQAAGREAKCAATPINTGESVYKYVMDVFLLPQS